MHDFPAGRLAVWATAWLSSRTSYDHALDALVGDTAHRVSGLVAGHRRGVRVTVVTDRAHIAVAVFLRARLRRAVAIGADRLPDRDGDAEDEGEQGGEPRQLQGNAHAETAS